jgi:hypothetical protein
LQLVNRHGLLRTADVTQEWADHIPCRARLQGGDQWNIGRELNSIGSHPQVQVGPKFEGGRKRGHAGGAENYAIQPAGDGQRLLPGIPQFVSGGIDNRKHEGTCARYRRV